MTFPIDIRRYRELPTDWRGDVVVADVDRTYLATRFSSLRGLARIPFEQAADKQDLPGMARLLRELRRGPGPTSRETPLFFVSASPGQLRAVIERKLVLDGIGFDGTTFKDWVGVARTLRFGRLREQLGFKLTALLVGRLSLPDGARELLLGDDLESDALAFALYADLVSGRIDAATAGTFLDRSGVRHEDAAGILEMAERVHGTGHVRRALIRLEKREAADFLAYGGHVMPCWGAFQMAAVAWDEGVISMDGVVRVAAAELGARRTVLADRLHDCLERSLVGQERGEALARRLAEEGLVGAIRDVPSNPSWSGLREESREMRWTEAVTGRELEE